MIDLPKLPDVSLYGSLGVSTSERLAFQRTLSKQRSPLVRGRILHRPLLLPCTPEACHEVLVTKAKHFEKAPGLRVLLYMFAGQGLFTSEGALWQRQRKLMSPIFQPAPMHQYAETMRQVATRAADRMRDGEAIDVAQETTRIAMSIVGKALFDADTFDDADALGAALTTALSWVNHNVGSPGLIAHVLLLDAIEALGAKTSGSLNELFESAHKKVSVPFLLPGVRDEKLRSAVKLLDERIQDMIDERRRQGFARKDLLTRLLTAQDEDKPGAHMSDKQVRDEAVTLFVAGHETTATALAWSFYLLAKNPEVRDRAQAEADAFGSDPITQWDPTKLEYCTRVFKEVLRLFPPVMMFPRRAIDDVEICGVTIPRKTLTFVSAYAQHYREDSYEDPHRFDPDRWLPQRESLRPKGSYLPFSAGPRFCIGVHFAMMEGPIVLATLLQRWRFEIDSQKTIEEDDFATLRPKGGVPAFVRSR